MAIRRDSLTMKLAAALLAFVAVFLGVRALDGGSESLTGQPRGGGPGGRAPRRHHRSADRGPAGPGARGALRSRRLRPARARLPPAGARDGRPDLLPEGPGHLRAGSAARSQELHRHQRPRFARPRPPRLPPARSRSASRPPGSTRAWPATTASSPMLRSSSAATGRRSAPSSTTSTSSRSSPRMPGSPTSASSTATCPVRSRRCAWRSPPAAARPRTSATSRRWSGSSSSTAATTPAAERAYRTALETRSGLPRRHGGPRPDRGGTRRLPIARSAGSGRWSSGCRCPST